MQVGQVSERIEVSAQTDLLQAENASIGTVIENKGVTELPLNGRNYLGLVALSANVDTLSPSSGQAGSREGGDRASQSISAAGQRIMFDYFTLDGVNNTDPDFNTYVTLPSVDAIQEFKVQTGVYPAEFGHQVLRRSTYSPNPAAMCITARCSEFLRNNYFDAAIPLLVRHRPSEYLSVQVERLRFRNRWTHSYSKTPRRPQSLLLHGQRRVEGAAPEQPGALYASHGGRTEGGFGGLGGNDLRPHHEEPLPRQRDSYQPARSHLPQSFSATTPQPPCRWQVNNYPLFLSSPLNRDGFTLRSDFVESSKSQWTFRYSWGDENQSSTGLGGAGSKILTNYEQYLGTNTRSITPSLVNEARFGYTRFFNSIGTLSAFSVNPVATLGVPGLQAGAPATWGIPAISFTGDGFSGIGDNTDGPYVIDNNTLQILDNLSWIKGKHTFRFGFEYNRQNFNQVGNQFSRGNFVFQPNATQSTAHTGGDAFAEFLLGDLYQSTVAVAIANAQFQRNVEAAFFDDTYKFTPKLTLSLGLRYELTPPWVDQLGNNFTVAIPQIYFAPQAPQSMWPHFVRQGNCTDPYGGLSINWTDTTGKAGTEANPPPVCSNGTYTDALMKTAYNNWAPRVSVSYSPDAKLVVRAGVGLFYNQDIGNAVFDMARNIAGRVTQTSGQNGGTVGVPNLFYSNAVPGGSGAVAQLPPPYAYADAYSHRTSYTMESLLNIQRQFGQNWVIEGGYLGTQSRHLYGFQDANQAIPYGYIGNGAATSVASRLPFANYGVIQLVHDGGNGNYNSFSLKATRRFNQGVSVITSYTFSKSIDDTSGIRVQGFDTLFPQNSNCIACERGLSSFDVRHRSVTSLLYELPFGNGKRFNITNPFADAIVGGWQVGRHPDSANCAYSGHAFNRRRGQRGYFGRRL